jgi:hypothetical protein
VSHNRSKRDGVAGSYEQKQNSNQNENNPTSLCSTFRCAGKNRVCRRAALFSAGSSARAGIAYGTINNFDTVNDTSNVCHGFEIELDDCRSADITYRYSYNHYGTPKFARIPPRCPVITNCFVRYAAVYSNGVWSAYTAIPSGPIAPTAGHAFTNPGINFGGEHFGVGYYGNPTSLKYNWLPDDGTGNLVLGPPCSFRRRFSLIIRPLQGGGASSGRSSTAGTGANSACGGFRASFLGKSIKTVNHTNRCNPVARTHVG